MSGSRRRITGPSDSTLNKLWRQAVLVKWNYTDPLMGYYSPNGEALQCHHVVFRRHYLLRWDVNNGVPLTTESHHAVHHYPDARRMLEDLTDMKYLSAKAKVLKKDYLQENNMSDAEFRQETKSKLESVIRSEV